MPEFTPAHALIRGLRSRGSEAELTQAIASVLAAEPRAAAAFARAAVAAAPRARPADVEAIPQELSCRAEQTLAEGRADLEFSDRGRLLHLIVEIKLYAGYGHEQLQRYPRSFRAERTMLVAVTRDVPTYGDLADEPDPRWLGSVRWAKLLPSLRTLPIRDEHLFAQWPLFLDVLRWQAPGRPFGRGASRPPRAVARPYA